jgi:ATP:ADP antiporter, AAA family
MPDILPPKRVSANTGLNILELGEASPEQVTLVRLVLKKINATEAELWQLTQELPEKRRMSRAVFDETLQKLVESKWLWKTGTGEVARYSPRLKKQVSRTQMRFQLTQSPGAAITNIWTLLEQREKNEAVTATSATPTRPSLVAQIGEFFAERIEAGKLVFGLMLVLSAVNAFAMASIEVTGVSGFVQSVGPQNLPWLTIAEMLLGLLASAAYLQVADRLPRLRLMKGMTAILVAVYLVTAGLFALATSTHALDGLAAALHLSAEALIYPLLYLIRSQQVILFPIAFWNLANSLYSMAAARKVFPAIASGETLGGLAGYALFAEFFGRPALFDSHAAPILLALSAGMYLLCLGVMHFVIKEPDTDVDTQKESFLDNIREGLNTIHNVPLFRYLALGVMLVWLTFPLLEYHFFTSLDLAAGQEIKFENFYSLFSIANTLLTLLLQWRLVGILSKRVETRSAFIALPVTLALGALVALFVQNLYVAAGVLLCSYVVYASWDAPMMNTLQSLIPEERRARVSTLLSNYSYAVGKIVGSLILGLILAFRPNSGTALSFIYLPVALFAATMGIIATVVVRQTYEKSMLSWRIARRQRSASVLDKLDF